MPRYRAVACRPMTVHGRQMTANQTLSPSYSVGIRRARTRTHMQVYTSITHAMYWSTSAQSDAQWCPGMSLPRPLENFYSYGYEFDRPFHTIIHITALVPFIYHIFSPIAHHVHEIKSLGGAIFPLSSRFSPRINKQSSSHSQCR